MTEEEKDLFHVSHEFTNFMGVPGDFEEVTVYADDKDAAIKKAKLMFDKQPESEDSIEVMKMT